MWRKTTRRSIFLRTSETQLLLMTICKAKGNFFINFLSSEFRVEDYDDLCEDFSKIDKVVCLKYSCFKIFCLSLLNLLTVFIINLFIVWYPSLKLSLIYSTCSLKEAKFVGVYGRGKSE
jgi:hypothetical protein